MEDGMPAGEQTLTADAGNGKAATPLPRTTPRLLTRVAIPQARSLATWLLVVRPHALLFAVAPVIVTFTALLAGRARVAWNLGVATVLAVGLAQAGCSALDAYLEYQRRTRAIAAGETAVAATPSPLIARGIYPLEALRTGCVLLALGALAGIPLVLAGGPAVLALGVGGITLGLLYSMTPFALKLLPLGDVALFVALGPGIAALTVAAQRRPLTWSILLISLALSFYMLASVFAAHLRDTERLAALGRRTLASFLNDHQRRIACIFCVGAAYLLAALVALPVGRPHLALLAFLSVPAAALPLTGVWRAVLGEPQALVVRQLGRAYGRFAFWLAIGLALTAIWMNLP
jgi:1,4-dihydroxy-2-naphthoate octaprenyltransferase